MVKDMAGKKSYVAQELKKMVIAKLRPKLEPPLTKAGVAWEEVLPVLEAITVEILKQCANTSSVDPIMEELCKASGQIAIKFALAKMRPLLKPNHLATMKLEGVAWNDVVSAIASEITLEDATTCADTKDVGPIVEKLAEAAGPIALKLAIAETRQMLQPRLAELKLQGKTWNDVVLVIATSGITIADVRDCVQKQDVELLVQKLAQSDGRTETVAGAKMGKDDCDTNV